MWDAIHSETEKIYLSTDVWDIFDNPHKEEWYCCPLHKYPVTPVKAHKRKINNEEINVLPHFRNITDKICSGESIEHWQTKVMILLGLKEKKIDLIYRGKKINYEIKNIDVEVTKENRRADILMDIEFNTFLGNGLVIEVLVSEEYDNFLLKAKDWIQQKYSVTSIKTTTTKQQINIEYPFGLYEPNIRWCNSLKWNKKKIYNKNDYNLKKHLLMNDTRSWKNIPEEEKSFLYNGVMI